MVHVLFLLDKKMNKKTFQRKNHKKKKKAQEITEIEVKNILSVYFSQFFKEFFWKFYKILIVLYKQRKKHQLFILILSFQRDYCRLLSKCFIVVNSIFNCFRVAVYFSKMKVEELITYWHGLAVKPMKMPRQENALRTILERRD